MNELKIFKHTTFGELGILVVDGKELFPATESAKLLGYADRDQAIRRHCRYPSKQRVPHPQNPDKTIEMKFIPEGDLYRLIARSKLPAAEQFERWVFDEVLPAIRKDGVYATPQTLEAMLNDPDAMIATLQALKTERDARKVLENENHKQRQVITKLRPKASYCDVILRTPEPFPQHHRQGLRQDCAMAEQETARPGHPVQGQRDMAFLCRVRGQGVYAVQDRLVCRAGRY